MLNHYTTKMIGPLETWIIHLSFYSFLYCQNPYSHMWLSEQKPAMFALKLKFILLPQLIATLNNYACALPSLANVDWSAFPECFFADHVNPRLVKWRQRRAPGWLWGPDMAPTVSARLSRPCSGILALCGCMYTS